jgi:hypothetical protein
MLSRFFVHYRLISKTGSEHGIRDVDLRELAVARPKATFNDNPS